MANWAWPHTPSSNCARLILAGGPFNAVEVGFLPPDIAVPIQIAWGGWFPWGFAAYVYEWKGDTVMDQGRTHALLYLPTGRRLDPGDIPPLLADDTEVWADGAALILAAFDVPANEIWSGV